MSTDPGWHPDPTGRFSWRYWDGHTWTSHVANNGATSTDAMSPPPAGDPAKPWNVAPQASPWSDWRRFLRPSVAGRPIHPLVAICIALAALWLMLGLISGMRNGQEARDYYDGLYDTPGSTNR